jgi:hypothetical protein
MTKPWRAVGRYWELRYFEVNQKFHAIYRKSTFVLH